MAQNSAPQPKPAPRSPPALVPPLLSQGVRRSAASELLLLIMKTPWLIASMVLAVLLVGALASWDQSRSSAAALEDFADSQAALAQSAAATLRTSLESILDDARVFADDTGAGRKSSALLMQHYVDVRVRSASEAPLAEPRDPRQFLVTVQLPENRRVDLIVPISHLLDGLAQVDHPGETAVLLLPPGGTSVHTLDGRMLERPMIARELEGAETTMRLTPQQASGLGLPTRTAMAGLARVSVGPLGRWGVAVLASAEHVRDRDRQGKLRLLLSMLLVTGLILGFGGLAVRKQRAELQLEHELAVTEVARERDTKLERMNKAALMATLASGVAHEVSTPLAVIVGRAEQLVARAGNDERMARSAQAILEQADHINRVVRGLLGLARGTPPAMESTDPGQVLEAALALVEHRFQQAGVRLEKRVQGPVSAIRCEPLLLEHAVVNLLLNACEASPAGALVAAEVATAPDGGVLFSVLDEGSGISEAHAARVTEPFFTTKASGTGLGLALATEIVKTHRGDLALQPRAPRGTAATIHIPAETAAAESGRAGSAAGSGGALHVVAS